MKEHIKSENIFSCDLQKSLPSPSTQESTTLTVKLHPNPHKTWLKSSV